MVLIPGTGEARVTGIYPYFGAAEKPMTSVDVEGNQVRMFAFDLIGLREGSVAMQVCIDGVVSQKNPVMFTDINSKDIGKAMTMLFYMESKYRQVAGMHDVTIKIGNEQSAGFLVWKRPVVVWENVYRFSINVTKAETQD